MLSLFCFSLPVRVFGQGWPKDYGGVMLQGFYWDSFDDTRWDNLERLADELSPYFSLIWVPQSGYCNTSRQMMGYTPVFYFNQNCSFGTETQLRRMIATFREHGTGIIADVVINHRNNIGANGSWVDYPAETYQGKTYKMQSTDICRDDDGGATLSWAKEVGVPLSTSADSGEDWPGCRDLDHSSPNVQRCVKAYLDFLLNDIGYVGFRYDMVKGYYASYIADYNMAAKPMFSVGEYWDGTDAIRQWINYSKGYVSSEPTSAAFDFQFRWRVRDAIEQGGWNLLGSSDMVIKDDYFKRYAVTFVENHDTEKRSNDDQYPLRSDTLQANAFLLAMPGTPCVFLKHWQAYKQEIKAMIEARRLAGITNTSAWEQKACTTSYYAVETKGNKGELVAVVGKKSAVTSRTPYISKKYIELFSGPGYRYLLSDNVNVAWADLADGTFDAPQQVRLVAVTGKTGASLVYTLDGTDPTPQSTHASTGTLITIGSTCTLKVALLTDGFVEGICTRHYVIEPFLPHTATVYVRNENTWSRTNFYAWDSPSNKQLLGSWPGKYVTKKTTVDGHTWLTHSFDIPDRNYHVNLVLSNGTSGSPQTVDVTGVTSDCYLVITKEKSMDGKYIVHDVTKDVLTSLHSLATVPVHISGVFDMQGRRVTIPNTGQLIIKDGRKVLSTDRYR